MAGVPQFRGFECESNLLRLLTLVESIYLQKNIWNIQSYSVIAASQRMNILK